MSEEIQIGHPAIQATCAMMGIAAALTSSAYENSWPTTEEIQKYSVVQNMPTFSAVDASAANPIDHHDEKFAHEIAAAFANIAKDQAPLGAEFEKIWDENAATLYEA